MLTPDRPRLDGAALLAGCRQAGYRDRVRQAEAERQRLARLAEAKAEAARLWRPLEACGLTDLPEITVAVIAGYETERPVTLSG